MILLLYIVSAALRLLPDEQRWRARRYALRGRSDMLRVRLISRTLLIMELVAEDNSQCQEGDKSCCPFTYSAKKFNETLDEYLLLNK